MLLFYEVNQAKYYFFRRIIERKGDTIKNKLKYEQKLFQLYLRGELKYDSDLEAIRKELEKKSLVNY